MEYDVVVIGGGYGGLTAASILAKRGFSICLVEAHTSVGGCAGHFSRKGFRFDAGATTLSGVLAHQPLGRVFSEVGVQPNLRRESVGMMIHLENDWIARYADRSRWLEESVEKFHIRTPRLYYQFWQEVYDIESRIWELTERNYALPPTSLRDLVSLARISNLRGLPLITKLLRPIASLMREHDLLDNHRFVRFVDQQLLISTQNTHQFAPIATAAMGLAYPSETYYPVGGMIAPAELLAKAITRYGGVVRLKHRVLSIARYENGYSIDIEKGGARPERITMKARCVISNATVWNMRSMTEKTDPAMSTYFSQQSRAIDFAWGAFMLYGAVQTDVALPTAYYQIHTDQPLPYCESNSFFISFSHADDRTKAPIGWRTFTISTHTPTSAWLGCSEEEYHRRKQIVQNCIMQALHHALPALRSAPCEYLLSATPKSFAFFTRREQGFVGGVPHSIQRSLLRMTPNVTPFQHFYMVGDTVFPGQGTPSVALGALNVAERVTRFL